MTVHQGFSHWIPDPAGLPPLRRMTVGALLDEAAERWPGREAIVYAAYADLGISERWTYRELRDRAKGVAAAFIADGFEPGDRVGVWATNRPEWLLVQFGAAYAGVVLVPMNPLYRLAEVIYVLGRSGASGCFAEPENRGADLWEILRTAAAELPELRRTVALAAAGDAPAGSAFTEWVGDGIDRVPEKHRRRRETFVRPEHTAQIQFTSGTTGFPKGAELHHAGIVDNARLFAHRARLQDGGRHCNPMPYFHCGGCVMSTLGSVATGSTQLPTLTFDPVRVARTIDLERATSFSAVPTMLIAVDEAVDRTGASLRSLELVITGGSPVPVEVERRWIERYGVAFTVTYGMTEASPVVTMSDPEDPEALQLATCGQPMPHTEVDIVGPDGLPVPIGEHGELRTRGPMVMKGYWGDPAATARAVSADGWLWSGDRACMDAEGYVSITGRAKDVIIRGGENIYPAEIEDALRTLPQVLDASVIGVPDARYGEQVAAYVRLADDATLTLASMRAALEQRVARYKVPHHLQVVDAFPVTPSGKVQKFRLQERFALEHDEPPG